VLNQRALIAAVIAASGLAASASAQTQQWNNPFGGVWGAASNWTPENVPDAVSEFAVIAIPGTYTVILDLNPTVGGITIGNPNATLEVPNTRQLISLGVSNTGWIVVNPTAGGSATTLRIDGGGVLDGSGTIVLNASAANITTATLQANGGTATHGAGHTVRGAGRITGPWVNNGLISADMAEKPLELSSGDKTNNAMMRAAGGGVLRLIGITVAQGPAGQIIADGGEVALSNARVDGGTLEAVNGGFFSASSTSTLSGVALTGPLGLANTGMLIVDAAGLTNDGQITVNTTAGGSAATLRIDGGVIDGSGTIVLNASAANIATAVLHANVTTATHGAGHTIRGAGRIIGPWVNNGLISADMAEKPLELSSGDKTNNAMMRSTGGGVLQLSGITVAQGPAGQVVADGGEVVLSNARVDGGTLEAVNGGVVTSTGTSTLSGVALTGPLGLANTGMLIVDAAGLTNDGQITVNTTAGGSAATLRIDGGVIDGSGTIVLNASAANIATAVLHANGAATFGPGQTIAGRGRVTGSHLLHGTIAPGSATAAGFIEVGNALTLTETSTVAIKVGGLAPTEFDRSGGSGAKAIDGRLVVTLLDDYIPSGTTLYDIVTGSSITGEFAELDLPTLPGGRRMHVGYAPTAVRLTACASDWNVDGSVNSNDISAFLTSWLGSVGEGGLYADFNGDGAVNSNDISAFLTAWLSAIQGGC